MFILQKKKKKIHPYGFREQGIQRNEKFKYFWKKVPRPYEFSSYEIHRTKNLFGVTQAAYTIMLAAYFGTLERKSVFSSVIYLLNMLTAIL